MTIFRLTLIPARGLSACPNFRLDILILDDGSRRISSDCSICSGENVHLASCNLCDAFVHWTTLRNRMINASIRYVKRSCTAAYFV